MGCNSSKANTAIGELDEEETQWVSCESWWLYALLREKNCDFAIFGTQTRMASADYYSCIYDDILVLTSVYCLDWIKFSDDILIISVLFLKGEICRKNLSCAELFLLGIFGAASAAPNIGTTILYWLRSLSTVLSPTENSRIQGLLSNLNNFPVLFKPDLIFKYLSRKPPKFKYFSSLCEPCSICTERRFRWVWISSACN